MFLHFPFSLAVGVGGGGAFSPLLQHLPETIMRNTNDAMSLVKFVLLELVFSCLLCLLPRRWLTASC